MTGRILGPSTLPPEDPAGWSIVDKTIYGCTLCRRLNNAMEASRESLSYIRNGELASVDFSFDMMRYHGPSVELSNLPSDIPLSICVSMGHIYTRPVNTRNINLARYKLVDSNRITIINEDLPYLALVLYNGRFYNHSAAIITEMVAETSLVNLAKAHHKLANSLSDPNTYQVERSNFIMMLDEYLAPPEVKLDTPYGLKTVKFLLKNINFQNNSNMPLKRIQVKSALGKVYQTTIVNDMVVLKYQVLDDRDTNTIWEVEHANGQFINQNLDNNPALPYPYTYHAFRCTEVKNIESLNTPSCPTDGTGKVGVFVQQYIESIGSLHDYATANPAGMGLPIYIEALATLAEAHQGSTVKNHFMHLDSHGGNFLISTCGPEVRNCSPKHSRLTDFGAFKFRFGGLNYRVYMIDFGFSHFLGYRQLRPINHDLPQVELHNVIYSAYDLITLQRGTLAGMVDNFTYGYSQHSEYRSMKDVIIRMLVISSIMIADQIASLVNIRVQNGYAFESVDDSNVFNLDKLSSTIYNTYRTKGREGLQLYLIDYILHTITYAFEIPYQSLDKDSYSNILSLLCGIYNYTTRGYSVRDRKIYQHYLEHLPNSVLAKLNIPPAPSSLTGIPILIWYISKYVMRIPVE